MSTRRDFLKQVALLGGGASVLLSDSVRRAFAIDPAPGTTFLDAEHVVILMQENRSFDHVYGTLRGVRGFDDPRAIQLPSGHPVWLQTNAQGETFVPFRLDIHNTKVTWLGSLPHSWTDQVDARNNGRYDRWLQVKASGRKECAGMPFTLGTYTREDLPFYYDLADAFTVCDQHFCSSLTGTIANRLYLWTGTIRGTLDATGRPRVNNSDTEYENSCAWTTFPERLEGLGISWAIYQNEISSVDVGFEGEEAAWLANFSDNPLEWFPQHHAGFSPGRQKYLDQLVEKLPAQIEDLQAELKGSTENAALQAKLDKAQAALAKAREQRAKWSPEAYAKLSPREKNLHDKANTTNTGDPYYHELSTLTYRDGATERTMQIPRGDVLDQFRKDVDSGKLPAVSWIIAPENFSDHPGAAWYGAWYVSEVLNILTKNPAVWKKTIFILTYDENDGYFDHVPPFVAPHPAQAQTGAVSRSIRTEGDFVTMEEELKYKKRESARESSIGLGYRVPLVVASPWSRGGYVNSQVFDHTSVLQFLEKFLSAKTTRPVQEPNITTWRRAVCGDLTSLFRPYNGEAVHLPPFVEKKPFVQGIHQAQFKPAPTGFKPVTPDQMKNHPLLRQEPGTRPSCGLPYELSADGRLNREKGRFDITFAARTDLFGAKSAGSAFHVYAPGRFRGGENDWEVCRSWDFAVAPGEELAYSWPTDSFAEGLVFLRVYGPNGFFREFRRGPEANLECTWAQQHDSIELTLSNTSNEPAKIEAVHNAYQKASFDHVIAPGRRLLRKLDLKPASGWYDFTVRLRGSTPWEIRYAGRIETGAESISDPLIGKTA